MAEPDTDHKSRRLLFLTFLKIGVCGFGGVAPWARRVIVEERQWLSELDYAELLGVCSALPGANTVNIAVILGDRYNGILGSVSAVAGLLLMPLVILVGIAALYERFAGNVDVRNAVAGAAAATAGLVLGTGLKMISNLRPDILAAASCAAIFVLVGLFQTSLALSLVALAAIALVARIVMERRTRGGKEPS
jgi:chromate transporter